MTSYQNIFSKCSNYLKQKIIQKTSMFPNLGVIKDTQATQKYVIFNVQICISYRLTMIYND